METQKEPSSKSRLIPFDKMAIICSVLLVTGTIFVANGLTLIYWANKPSDNDAFKAPVPTSTPTAFTSSPTLTFTPTLTPTITQTFTTTPIPTTPEPVVVAPLAGNVVYSKIDSSKFAVPNLQINVSDTVVFDNWDDIGYMIVELDQKIDNITLGYGKRTEYVFDKAGSYRFGLYSIYGRAYLNYQNINVGVNVSLSQKSLTVGGRWDLAGGYYLYVQSIDAKVSPRQTWLVLYRNGEKVDDKVLREGQRLEYNNFNIRIDRIYAEINADMIDLTMQ